jgi:ribosomal protein L22
MDIRELSDDEVIAGLDKRVEFETTNEAEMIDFIREVMFRRIWLKYGADNMYDFMTRAHYHYPPSVAQRKTDAARIMEVFPEVKDLMLAEELNVSQLGMLATALRQKEISVEKQREVLETMRGQTIENTRIILNEAYEMEVKKREKIRVQRDGSVRADLTFTKEEWEIITRAKELVSHSVPSGEIAKVLAYCAAFTVSKKDSTVTAAKEVKPRQSQGVSRASRRFIFKRDKSCRFQHPDGRTCGSKYQLQVDHIISKWKGGSNEPENLQLLCGIHNRYKYEREILRV